MMKNGSVFSAIFDDLSLTTPQFQTPTRLSNEQLTRSGSTVPSVFVFVNIGLVIFGTIGNIMTLAVFRMYQKSSKSSATFLLQALCVVDTCYLLCLVPTEWMNCFIKSALGRSLKFTSEKQVFRIVCLSVRLTEVSFCQGETMMALFH